MIALFKKNKAGVKGILKEATFRVSTFFFASNHLGPSNALIKLP